MKKRWFIAGFLILLLAVIFWPRQKDEYADLVPVRPFVHSNANAFYLIQTHTPLTWEEVEPFMPSGGKAPRADYLAALLLTNAHRVKLLSAIQSHAHLQFPNTISYGNLLLYLSSLRNLAYINLGVARHQFASGQEPLAFQTLFDNLELCNMLRESGAGISGFYYSNLIKFQSLGLMRSFASQSTNAQLLAEVIHKLEAGTWSRVDMKLLAKEEFQWYSKAVNDFAAGNWPDTLGAPPAAMRAYLTRGVVFDPEETREILAERTRHLVFNIEKDFKSIQTLTNNYSGSMAFALMSGNGLGRILAKDFIPDANLLADLLIRYKTDFEATELILAIYCYREARKLLPDSLDALVPTFLTRVPMDGFTKKPLIYSKAKKLVYSAGRDLTDSGGIKGSDDIYVIDPPN